MKELLISAVMLAIVIIGSANADENQVIDEISTVIKNITYDSNYQLTIKPKINTDTSKLEALKGTWTISYYDSGHHTDKLVLSNIFTTKNGSVAIAGKWYFDSNGDDQLAFCSNLDADFINTNYLCVTFINYTNSWYETKQLYKGFAFAYSGDTITHGQYNTGDSPESWSYNMIMTGIPLTGYRGESQQSTDIEFDVLYDSSTKLTCSATSLTYESQVITVNGFKGCTAGNSSDFTKQGPITAKSLSVIMDGKVTTFAVAKMNGLLDENSQVIAPSSARLQLSLTPQVQQISNSYNIPKNYSIGSKGPAGGIVYYVDSTGQHGLEAQPKDANTLIPGQHSYTSHGSTYISDDSEQDGSYVYYNWDGAKAAASNYGAGWHLPTKDELNLLYQQRTVVGGFFSINSNFWYWSSTEYNADNAWIQLFLGGDQNYGGKGFRLLVRAVRTF